MSYQIRIRNLPKYLGTGREQRVIRDKDASSGVWCRSFEGKAEAYRVMAQMLEAFNESSGFNVMASLDDPDHYPAQAQVWISDYRQAWDFVTKENGRGHVERETI